MPIWGIDLGGTKIEGVVLSDDKVPKILVRKRIDTEAAQGYKHIISRIKLLIDTMAHELGYYPEKIGLGTPGAIDPISGLMKNANMTILNGRYFKEDVKKALGIPLKMANDANCFALAEYKMGIVARESPQANVVFGVIMGTGVGGGIVVNGQLIHGRQGIGGEWGHNFLDVSGGPCYCGKTGCVETVISGKNLERYHHEKFYESKKLKDIYQGHLSGTSPNDTHTIKRLITQFGRAIAGVINILDPDIIVIGGGVGNIDLLYTEGLKEVKEHVFNVKLDTIFHRPLLGDSAGVFGAAYLT